MHLLETYSVISGATISQCFIEESEIQLPDKPYMTFHGYNPKGSGRQYRSWNTVIDLLLSNSNFNLEIIQIGGINDTKYNRINHNYLGKTSYNSLAYLIRFATIHLGFDSLPVHLASHYNKKIVAIYAQYSNNTKPYFSKESDVVLLEPDFTKTKPVFSHDDPFNLINTILPGSIYDGVISLLNIS